MEKSWEECSLWPVYSEQWKSEWKTQPSTAAGGRGGSLCAWSAGVDGRAWSFCSELLIPSQHFVTLSHLFQGAYSFPLLTASFKMSPFTWVQREIQRLCGGEIHPWLVCKRPELSQETTWSYHSWSLGRSWVRCYHRVGFSYFLSSRGTC